MPDDMQKEIIEAYEILGTDQEIKKVRNITVEFKVDKTAKNAEIAVSHEGKGQRAEASVKRKGRALEVEINAGDVVAFRAVFNSLMRDFQIIQEEE